MKGKAAGLGQRLKNKNGRHDGILGKMALEIGFINAHILECNSPLSRLDLEDSIDHPKREGMRQSSQNLIQISHSDPAQFPLTPAYRPRSRPRAGQAGFPSPLRGEGGAVRFKKAL